MAFEAVVHSAPNSWKQEERGKKLASGNNWSESNINTISYVCNYRSLTITNKMEATSNTHAWMSGQCYIFPEVFQYSNLYRCITKCITHNHIKALHRDTAYRWFYMFDAQPIVMDLLPTGHPGGSTGIGTYWGNVAGGVVRQFTEG